MPAIIGGKTINLWELLQLRRRLVLFATEVTPTTSKTIISVA